jgi:hypothetical protein
MASHKGIHTALVLTQDNANESYLYVPSSSVSRLVSGVGVLSLNLASSLRSMDLNCVVLCASCSPSCVMRSRL